MNSLQGLLSGNLVTLAVGFALGLVPAILSLVLLQQLRSRLRRRHAQLTAANRRNQSIVEGSGEGVLELDNVGHVRYANPAAAKMLGYETEELAGLDYRVLINTQEDGDSRTDPVRRVRYTTDIMRGVGALLRKKNGTFRPVEYKILPVTEEGASVGTVLVFRDIGERVRLDNLLKDMQATAKIGGWEYDVNSKQLHWTEALYAIHDLPVGHLIDMARHHAFFDPEDRVKLQGAERMALEAGLPSDLLLRMTSARGRQLWVRNMIKAERRGGNTVRLHGTIQDVTDLVSAERKLRETRDFFELTLNAVPTPVTYVNSNMIVTYVNRALEEWYALPADAVLGRPLRDSIGSERFDELEPLIKRVMGGEFVRVTHNGVRNGRPREWQNHFVPQLGPNGEVLGFFSIVYDLTEQKRLEARLMQAQKMEAIGQLTGGIAHDFNNLLGVVIGNLQLLDRSVAETPTLARKVHTAMRAAARGADLTRRLLAFARRQILAPAVLDLNRQLSGLSELVQRTIGESIEVRMIQAHDLWHTSADPGQFENAILNLAINARDAMPQGGRLTVRTQNVTLDAKFCNDYPSIEPGDFVAISVNDNGVGMDAEVLKRVFEPFFTTKESGKGSGLGLAMVHSFAEQAGGIATIDSTVGAGTTVTIYLPRSKEEQSEREDTIVTRVAPGGTETILVVEDDADLRDTVVTALSQLGYRALAAANGAAAVRILSGPERIDLLFTDVMMPGGMLGPALAKRARELRPDIDVLFTTGYADNAVLAGTAGLTASDVIHKPYRNEDLAMRIRHVLDREARVA
ncbi:MAG TPA: PAS domain-containing protein [Steroidobacter sp.]|uniref:hybrid sensor histidine kinase/response regulator n=1 Tax=Steroidobacter sp. TaxID=1978227 RepID=UPI002EDB2011